MKFSYKVLLLFLSFLYLQAPVFATNSLANNQRPQLNTHQVYAVLSPILEATLASELNGIITNINFLPGEHFEKGDRLIEYNCKPIELEIKQINALLKGSKARLNSNRQLARLNSVSNLDLKLSESEHEKNLAKLEALQHQKEKCTVIAPFSGEVISKEVNSFEVVKVDEPLLTIVNNQKLEVQMYIPSSWLHQIKIGMPVKLYLHELKSKTPIVASLSKIVGKIDPASQSMLIYATIKPKQLKENKLYAGMSGHAVFSFDN